MTKKKIKILSLSLLGATALVVPTAITAVSCAGARDVKTPFNVKTDLTSSIFGWQDYTAADKKSAINSNWVLEHKKSLFSGTLDLITTTKDFTLGTVNVNGNSISFDVTIKAQKSYLENGELNLEPVTKTVQITGFKAISDLQLRTGLTASNFGFDSSTVAYQHSLQMNDQWILTNKAKLFAEGINLDYMDSNLAFKDITTTINKTTITIKFKVAAQHYLDPKTNLPAEKDSDFLTTTISNFTSAVPVSLRQNIIDMSQVNSIGNINKTDDIDTVGGKINLDWLINNNILQGTLEYSSDFELSKTVYLSSTGEVGYFSNDSVKVIITIPANKSYTEIGNLNSEPQTLVLKLINFNAKNKSTVDTFVSNPNLKVMKKLSNWGTWAYTSPLQIKFNIEQAGQIKEFNAWLGFHFPELGIQNDLLEFGVNSFTPGEYSTGFPTKISDWKKAALYSYVARWGRESIGDSIWNYFLDYCNELIVPINEEKGEYEFKLRIGSSDPHWNSEIRKKWLTRLFTGTENSGVFEDASKTIETIRIPVKVLKTDSTFKNEDNSPIGIDTYKTPNYFKIQFLGRLDAYNNKDQKLFSSTYTISNDVNYKIRAWTGTLIPKK